MHQSRDGHRRRGARCRREGTRGRVPERAQHAHRRTGGKSDNILCVRFSGGWL